MIVVVIAFDVRFLYVVVLAFQISEFVYPYPKPLVYNCQIRTQYFLQLLLENS